MSDSGSITPEYGHGSGLTTVHPPIEYSVPGQGSKRPETETENYVRGKDTTEIERSDKRT